MLGSFHKPGSSIAFDWHQDIPFLGIEDGRFEDIRGDGSFVQLFLALDDTTEESGPLMLIPESNHLGFLEPPLEQHPQVDFNSVAGTLLNAGDGVAFGPYIVYVSNANLAPYPRRVFISGFS